MSQQLIRVGKNGAFISVHPTCLASHQAQGWTVSDDQAQAPNDLDFSADDAAPKKGKGKGKADTTAATLTRTEIEADLTAMDVDFDPSLDDAALQALRDDARADRDAAGGQTEAG